MAGFGSYDELFPPQVAEDPALIRMAGALEHIAAGDAERTDAYEHHLRMRRNAADRHEMAVEETLGCDTAKVGPQRRRRDWRPPYFVRNLAMSFAVAFCASSGAVVALHDVFGIRL